MNNNNNRNNTVGELTVTPVKQKASLGSEFSKNYQMKFDRDDYDIRLRGIITESQFHEFLDVIEKEMLPLETNSKSNLGNALLFIPIFLLTFGTALLCFAPFYLSEQTKLERLEKECLRNASAAVKKISDNNDLESKGIQVKVKVTSQQVFHNRPGNHTHVHDHGHHGHHHINDHGYPGHHHHGSRSGVSTSTVKLPTLKIAWNLDSASAAILENSECTSSSQELPSYKDAVYDEAKN
eukprot:Awhi_evm1s11551